MKTQTGCWKHIESKASLTAERRAHGDMSDRDQPGLNLPDDDGGEGAITINVTRPSPSASAANVQEKEPLLHGSNARQ